VVTQNLNFIYSLLFASPHTHTHTHTHTYEEGETHTEFADSER